MANQIEGWYYLHENKEMIYKNNPDAIIDIRESDLCHSAWGWDGQRETAWNILVEALSLGAKKERIEQMAAKWKCTDGDAEYYATVIGVDLGMDGNKRYARGLNFTNLQECPCGFGDSYLEAMADLCHQLGYKGGKMWNASFKDLVKSSL